jgi:hypothetical protein
MPPRETRFLIALCLTLCVETPLFALCLFLWRKSPLSSGRGVDLSRPLGILIGLPAAASAMTLPYVWFVIPRLIPGYYGALMASEAFAVVAEALIYTVVGRFPLAFSATVSTACNAASFLIGFFIGPILYAAFR